MLTRARWFAAAGIALGSMTVASPAALQGQSQPQNQSQPQVDLVPKAESVTIDLKAGSGEAKGTKQLFVRPRMSGALTLSFIADPTGQSVRPLNIIGGGKTSGSASSGGLRISARSSVALRGLASPSQPLSAGFAGGDLVRIAVVVTDTRKPSASVKHPRSVTGTLIASFGAGTDEGVEPLLLPTTLVRPLGSAPTVTAVEPASVTVVRTRGCGTDCGPQRVTLTGTNLVDGTKFEGKLGSESGDDASVAGVARNASADGTSATADLSLSDTDTSTGEYKGSITFGDGSDAPELAVTGRVRLWLPWLVLTVLAGAIIAYLLGPLIQKRLARRTELGRLEALLKAYDAAFGANVEDPPEDKRLRIQPDSPIGLYVLEKIRNSDGGGGNEVNDVLSTIAQREALWWSAGRWKKEQDRITALENAVATWVSLAPSARRLQNAWRDAFGVDGDLPAPERPLDYHTGAGATLRLLLELTKAPASEDEAKGLARRAHHQAAVLEAFVRAVTRAGDADEAEQTYRLAPAESNRSRREAKELIDRLDSIKWPPPPPDDGFGVEQSQPDFAAVEGRDASAELPKLIAHERAVINDLNWLAFFAFSAAAVVAYVVPIYSTGTWGTITNVIVGFTAGLAGGGAALAWDKLPLLGSRRYDDPKVAAASEGPAKAV